MSTAVEVATPRTGPVVRTTRGAVRGTVEDGVYVFRGIPYAEPPVGRLRFRPPAPRAPWEGVRDATRFGHTHVQDDGGIEGMLMSSALRAPAGEDCLNLNVWTPDVAGVGCHRRAVRPATGSSTGTGAVGRSTEQRSGRYPRPHAAAQR